VEGGVGAVLAGDDASVLLMRPW